MYISLREHNLHMSRHGYCASHVFASSTYTSPQSKKNRVISSLQSYIFQDIINNLEV